MEEHKEEEKIHSKKKRNLTESFRENPWVVSTFVLGIFALVLIITSFTGGITGGTISEEDAGKIVIDFVNSQVEGQVELVSVGKESGLYEVIISIEGQEIPVYLTEDGKSLVQSVIPLDALMEQQINSQQTQQISEYTEEDNKKIQEFSKCLEDKGLVVYYAGWCGHCHTLIDTFGGLENAGDMMIECQTADGQEGEGADLCIAEEITGVPTIKINGEKYSGARTFDAFAEATGCVAPQL